MDKFYIYQPEIKSDKEVYFNFEFKGNRNDKIYLFTEKICFPFNINSIRKELLIKLLDRLSVLLGVSYYKVFCSPIINISFPVSCEVDIPFFCSIYRKGLGEFAYRNKKAEVFDVEFEYESITSSRTESIRVDDSVVLPVGGGKDSIVSLEALRASDIEVKPFAVNPKPVIRNCIKQAGLEGIYVQREISPKLIDLNKQGFPNGHVPVTAINSMISLIVAIATGSANIAFSNERSASEGNLSWCNIDINHQYSKSYEFEDIFRKYIKDCFTDSINYFSLLRPYSELSIGKAFSKIKSYDQIFTSCNKAFRLSDSLSGWCLECPKCMFVFLCLAPFMSLQRLKSIFGDNLLDNINNSSYYHELTGISGNKPWECVGEFAESQLSFKLLSKIEDWSSCSVVEKVTGNNKFKEMTENIVESDIMSFNHKHFLTQSYMKIVKDFFDEENG